MPQDFYSKQYYSRWDAGLYRLTATVPVQTSTMQVRCRRARFAATAAQMQLWKSACQWENQSHMQREKPGWCHGALLCLQVTLGVAGSWNLSAHWEAGLRGSSPAVLPTAYSYDLQGGPYMLQVDAATVQGVPWQPRSCYCTQ